MKIIIYQIIYILIYIYQIKDISAIAFCEKFWQDGERVFACVGYAENIKFNDTVQNVTELSLTRNNITIMNSSVLKNFESVRKLILTYNNIKQIEESTFSNLSDVDTINLSSNNLKELPENLFQYNYNLLGLYIRKNAIRKLKASTFSKLLDLQTLDLSFNLIEHLSKNLFQYSANLVFLSLRENLIREVSEETFSYLSKLTEIDLSYNKIETLTPHVFKYNFNLKIVRLRGNQIKLLDYSVTHLSLDIFDLLRNPLLMQDNEVKETLTALHRSNVKTYVNVNSHEHRHKKKHNTEIPTYMKFIVVLLSFISTVLLVAVAVLIYVRYFGKEKKIVPHCFTPNGSQECLISDDNYLKLKIPNGAALYVKNINGDNASTSESRCSTEEISKTKETSEIV